MPHFGLTNCVPITNAPHWSALRGKYAFGYPPTTPPLVDYLKLLPTDSGDMGNDGAGDCFWAAQYHGRQARTMETTGRLITEPRELVLHTYSLVTGYDPSIITTDAGTDPNQGFNWLAANGLPTSDGTSVKLVGAIELDPRLPADCLEAMDYCCGLSVGFQVPVAIASNPTPPQVWDFDPDVDNPSSEYHEVWFGSADESWSSLGFISWGLKFFMTRRFWDNCVNQVTATIYDDWFLNSDKSPFNMTREQLEAEMAPLRSGAIP